MGITFSGNLGVTSSNIVPIEQGGTNANTAAQALNNLLPSQTGNVNYYLKTNGSGTVTWAAGDGTGTVTSVDVSGGSTGLSFSGGPVTSSGTITAGGTLYANSGGTGLSSYTTGDMLYASGSSAISKLGVGSANTVLTSSGSAPQWSSSLNVTAVNVGTNIAVSNTGITMNSQTLQQPLFKNYALTTNALGNVSGATTVNISLGNYVTATATGATQWTFSNPPAGINAGGIILKLTNGGSATQTWPNGIKWPGGTAPSLTTSGVDVLVFLTDDAGTTWRGVACMLDSK